ncbi:MAG TPA: Ig-like domain-containing protein [Kofleriaceae bacterium]|nr:Ig-like domain-containing protein [Kofleriaceae bacterium]
MKLRVIVTGALMLAGTGIASAEQRHMTLDPYAQDVSMYSFVGEVSPSGKVLARQLVPTPTSTGISGTSAVLAQSKIIYLNKNGVTLQPGDNDSRTNRSTIAPQQVTIAPWNVSATNWQSTVSCMKDLFSRFDVTVTDVDPGNVPHMEAVFGGSPTQVGMDANTAGVSPFTLDCSIIENSIVFTFTGAFQMTPREACEVMAQEVAHSYGLDHQLTASDPMTYLDYTGNRSFQDTTAQCGEYQARNCGINGSTCRANQNSVALLKERLGTKGTDAVAPTMNWTSPANNATVPPGFEIHAQGTDNIAVTGAVLKIDGIEAERKTGAGPFVFVTSATLTEGAHQAIIEITDGINVKSETRTYTVKKGAPPPQDPGSGTGTGGGGGDLDQDVVGGCAAGGGQTSGLVALGLLGLAFVTRRRRR